MNRNPAPTHAAHDELLLARLYGGDLGGRERERARELAASCPECAAVLADFGAIAEATAALSVPPRPRDFTISAARARSLRSRRARPAGLRTMLVRLGPVRSLGASMTAVGVAGALALGAVSTFGQGGGMTLSGRQADAPAVDTAGSVGGFGASPGSEAWYSNGPALVTSPGAGNNTSPVPVAGSSDKASQKTAESPKAPQVSPQASGQFAAETSSAAGPQNDGLEADPHPEKGGSGATQDWLPLWLLGFGILAAGGLVLLATPTIRRRRSGGPSD